MRRVLLLGVATAAALAISSSAAAAPASYKQTRIVVEGSGQSQVGDRYLISYNGSLETVARCLAGRRLGLHWIRPDGGVRFATARTNRSGTWKGEGFNDPRATSLEIVVYEKRLGNRLTCGTDVFRQVITG